MEIERDSPPDGKRRTWWRVALSLPFVGLILLYRVTLSPLMGGQCRFHPTCSVYALECYKRFGPVRATMLTARRLSRCHPLGGSGYDPPPAD